MELRRLMASSALRSSLIVGVSLAAAAPAFAQGGISAPDNSTAIQETCLPNSTRPECLTDTDNETGDAIVITGSRIRGANIDSPVPVTAVAGEEIFQQGQTSIGDVLNDLPQLRSTFAQQNPGAGVGIAGLNLLDLRGLGTVRTLVLVNGRRHVPADILNNASSPDVNTIPTDLVERIDVLTGGNSALYGSDAIAGVVNFVLRRDFEGIQVRGNVGITEDGFGGNQYVSLMSGFNFADGRGNVTAHAEYSRQDRIYASDIPDFQRVDGFATVDADSAGLPSGSDGFPDAVFVRDIRSATNHRYGLVAIPQLNASPRCGQGTLANNGPTNTAGVAYHCNYIFDANGRLQAQTGTRFGTGPGGTFIGGNGQTGREGTQLSILPFIERYNTNLLARFEFAPELEAFLEAKFTRINSVGNQLGPTFLNNSTGSLGNDNRIDPRLDNPFLNATDRATIANAILTSGCGYNLGTALGTVQCRALTAAERTAVANGSYRFLFARNLTDTEDRDERFRRDTYRVVAGLRGTFNEDWSYEISGNYGRFEETVDMRGFVNRQRFLLSLDAGINPATGQIQCRAQFDPTAARGAPGYVNSAATLAADIAACVPYNPFGAGNNQAAAAYFRLPITNRSSIEQVDVLGFVSGDLSQLFELPGGPIAFALGGEYRREEANNNSDVAAETGISNSVFLGDVSGAVLEVKEAFGEIRVPILADTPFFEELSISGAGRISDYTGAVGTVYTYNAGVNWAPFRDIRFRGVYGRAVRAPNVSEAAFPAVPNFSNGFVDPCNVNAIGNNPVRSTNCQADLTAAQLANLQQAGYSLPVISGSNADLEEERSDSYTVGAVFTPTFVPGLSLSVDYFDITVNNVIVTLGAQAIVNACYDAPGFNSPLCSVFQRNRGTGAGPQGELPGQILGNTLVQGPQNFAKRKRRGIDTELVYRTNVTNDVRLGTRFRYTHNLQNSNFENPTDPDFENRLLQEIGDPQDEFVWDVDVTLNDAVTLGYQMRYIGPMYLTTWESFNPLNGLPPLNADAFDTQKYPSVLYHDLRADFRVGEVEQTGQSINFYVGVDNLTERQPPFGTTATGAGTAIYNIRGRSYYAGFRARF
ncbi:outer membrane receptor protein involved in Fe transport [Sphingomonas jejuensis]|uniref:Outer membrane receptor protein involved in Fe transport n=1 Tax=Sphingomonas jejuensis TaxID=904715 RepID=A0ABX0XMS2_9SPHN|nr:TonB-dependent receptor [Sphingomonas jejuensis]NJC34036.1 outer membrane receptor protein involved in Fe transport [Sphingomonas jejuensis]